MYNITCIIINWVCNLKKKLFCSSVAFDVVRQIWNRNRNYITRPAGMTQTKSGQTENCRDKMLQMGRPMSVVGELKQLVYF